MCQVTEAIEMLIDDYRKDRYAKPVGIVLGPREYRQLCEYCRRQHPEMKDSYVGSVMVSTFLDIPVFVKEMPGIDLLTPYDEAWKA